MNSLSCCNNGKWLWIQCLKKAYLEGFEDGRREGLNPYGGGESNSPENGWKDSEVFKAWGEIDYSEWMK